VVDVEVEVVDVVEGRLGVEIEVVVEEVVDVVVTWTYTGPVNAFWCVGRAESLTYAQ
jgi:hypothetical protein